MNKKKCQGCCSRDPPSQDALNQNDTVDEMLGLLSQQNIKCLTDNVKHDTSFVTYLKVSGRLESWRPLAWVKISLVLAPHELGKTL